VYGNNAKNGVTELCFCTTVGYVQLSSIHNMFTTLVLETLKHSRSEKNKDCVSCLKVHTPTLVKMDHSF
jgi:hypothetical protein